MTACVVVIPSDPSHLSIIVHLQRQLLQLHSPIWYQQQELIINHVPPNRRPSFDLRQPSPRQQRNPFVLCPRAQNGCWWYRVSSDNRWCAAGVCHIFFFPLAIGILLYCTISVSLQYLQQPEAERRETGQMTWHHAHCTSAPQAITTPYTVSKQMLTPYQWQFHAPRTSPGECLCPRKGAGKVRPPYHALNRQPGSKCWLTTPT